MDRRGDNDKHGEHISDCAAAGYEYTAFDEF